MIDSLIRSIQDFEEVSVPNMVLDFLNAQPREERAKGNHPSEIGSDFFCHKKAAIKSILKEHSILLKEMVAADSQLIFDIGHSLHDWYREKYLGPMGILKGKWLCPVCQKTYDGFYPRLDTCCNIPFLYREYKITIPEYDIVGHIDGIIVLDGIDYILDIKTINPEKFVTMEEPYNSYINQLTIYMEAVGIPRGILFFICKSTGQSRQFVIEHSRERFFRIVNDNIINLRKVIVEKKMPKMHRYCRPDSLLRTQCPVAKYCLGKRTWAGIEALIRGDT